MLASHGVVSEEIPRVGNPVRPITVAQIPSRHQSMLLRNVTGCESLPFVSLRFHRQSAHKLSRILVGMIEKFDVKEAKDMSTTEKQEATNLITRFRAANTLYTDIRIGVALYRLQGIHEWLTEHAALKTLTNALQGFDASNFEPVQTVPEGVSGGKVLVVPGTEQQ